MKNDKEIIASKEILASIDRVPLLPQSVAGLFEIVNNPGASPEDLAAIVNQDPSLAMQALHLCNSAYYSLPVEVTSVSHAIKLLGGGTVAGLAMAAYFQGLIKVRKEFSRNPWTKGLGDHFLETARFSECLVKAAPCAESPSTAFTAGLLHDIGKLSLATLPVDLARKVADYMQQRNLTIVDAEQEVLGIDHAEVGWLVAQRWKLPEIIEDSIRYHHKPFGGRYLMSLVIYVSNILIHSMDSNQAEREKALSAGEISKALPEIGISMEEVADLMEIWVSNQGKPGSHSGPCS